MVAHLNFMLFLNVPVAIIILNPLCRVSPFSKNFSEQESNSYKNNVAQWQRNSCLSQWSRIRVSLIKKKFLMSIGDQNRCSTVVAYQMACLFYYIIIITILTNFNFTYFIVKYCIIHTVKRSFFDDMIRLPQQSFLI